MCLGIVSIDPCAPLISTSFLAIFSYHLRPQPLIFLTFLYPSSSINKSGRDCAYWSRCRPTQGSYGQPLPKQEVRRAPARRDGGVGSGGEPLLTIGGWSGGRQLGRREGRERRGAFTKAARRCVRGLEAAGKGRKRGREGAGEEPNQVLCIFHFAESKTIIQ